MTERYTFELSIDTKYDENNNVKMLQESCFENVDGKNNADVEILPKIDQRKLEIKYFNSNSMDYWKNEKNIYRINDIIMVKLR